MGYTKNKQTKKIDGVAARKTAPVLTSDIGDNTVLVLAHQFVMP